MALRQVAFRKRNAMPSMASVHFLTFSTSQHGVSLVHTHHSSILPSPSAQIQALCKNQCRIVTISFATIILYT
jgi:hypothetical protein